MAVGLKSAVALATGLLTALCGCAHSYYYVPEIDGEGAIHGRKGGIVYTIPPKGQSELTLRVRALGIKRVHETQMLGMRMSFARPKGTAREPGISNSIPFNGRFIMGLDRPKARLRDSTATTLAPNKQPNFFLRIRTIPTT